MIIKFVVPKISPAYPPPYTDVIVPSIISILVLLVTFPTYPPPNKLSILVTLLINTFEPLIRASLPPPYKFVSVPSLTVTYVFDVVSA